MSNISKLFSRVGGEAKDTDTIVVTRNPQPELRLDTASNDTAHITMSSAKFDYIVTFFQKKGISESLARTYGVALIEISQETGKDVSELIDFNNFSETSLTDITMTTINRLRNKTAQIGYTTRQENAHYQIQRTVVK